MTDSESGPIDRQIHLLVQFNSERRRRLRILMLIAPGVIGLLLFAFSTEKLIIKLGYDQYVELSSIMKAGAAVSLLLALLSLAMSYLQTGFKDLFEDVEKGLKSINHRDQYRLADDKQVSHSLQTFDVGVLLAELSDLRGKVAQLEAENIGNAYENVAQIVEELKERIINDSGEEFLRRIEEGASANTDQLIERVLREGGEELLRRADGRLFESLKTRHEFQSINNTFEESKARLYLEISRLERKSNFNLSLGGITTIIGISLLWYAVFSHPQVVSSVEGFAIAFLPRLSVVILLQVFSFFFLKLYKSNLSEVKYFQNEITNVELRQIAVNAAMERAKDDQWKDLLVILLNTERNRILEKGQTTIDIEHARIDGNTGAIEMLTKLVPLFKK